MDMLLSGLPKHVSDEESLARFLNSSALFKKADGQIKPAAFMHRNEETSVFRQDTIGEESLWNIGEEIIPEGRRIHGIALIQAAGVRLAGLDVVAKEPPPKHANIVGWVAGSTTINKARNKELAILLAQGAELKRKP